MRLTNVLAGAALAVGLMVGGTAPVLAGGDDDCKCDHARPRYHRHIAHVDPYHWRYAPRGYYPYYANSGYWRVSHRKPRYRYAPGWGYPGAVRHWRYKGVAHGHDVGDVRHFNWEY